MRAGDEALGRGEWVRARDCFRAALDRNVSAAALLGLAQALWWLGDVRESVACRERAYVAFRRGGEAAGAFDVAVTLCIHYRANIGNPAAAAGWLARAGRLVEECGLQERRGWLQLVAAGHAESPSAGERLARQARELATDSGDLDLELCALAEAGAMLVKQGRLEEGLAMLDEAMAGSLAGEGGDFDTVVFTSCHMIDACASCAEFERAVQWVRAADRFTERYGCPFLYVYCRVLYGGVLVATGEWGSAEAELGKALELSRDSLAPLHGLALATLAELWLAQGRIEEAERLLVGLEDQPAAAPAMAAIHLVRGDLELAEAVIDRGLRAAGDDELRRARLLELFGELEIARHEIDRAAERGCGLAELGAQRGCESVRARGERLHARALAANADSRAARPHLVAALEGFAALGMPLEAARTRLLLARALLDVEPEVAVAEGRRALDAFEELGAGSDADAAAALLRSAGVKAARAGPKGTAALTKREREVLSLLGEGLSNPEIASRLYLSRKTVEHHVAHVLSKLGARSRAEAAAHAVRERGRESGSK